MNFIYISAFVSTFLLSLLFSYWAEKICYKYKILSIPRQRDVHKKPIPRLGGVAIFGAFLIVSLIYFLLVKTGLRFGEELVVRADPKLIGIWIGGGIITFSMLLDDLFGLKAWQKFAIQIVAVLAVISAGVGIDTLTNPFGGTISLNSVYIPIFTIHGITYHFSLWSDILTLLWMVGMMNVMNFIDGIDGLASGLSVIAAFTIFLLSVSIAVNQPAVALLSIILAGTAAGFLVRNFPPAKIFMGDSGSMFLGFMLGVLPLISGGKLATAFLVLGFPIVDGLVVAGSRLIHGKNPFTTPDKTHLHHRFIAAGFSIRASLIFLYLIAASFAWVALRSTTKDKLVAAVILVLVLTLLIIFLRQKAKSRR